MNKETWSKISVKGWRLDWVKLNQQQPDWRKSFIRLHSCKTCVYSSCAASLNALSLSGHVYVLSPRRQRLRASCSSDQNPWCFQLTRSGSLSFDKQQFCRGSFGAPRWEPIHMKADAGKQNFYSSHRTHALLLSHACDLRPPVLSRCSKPAALIDNSVVYECRSSLILLQVVWQLSAGLCA